MFPDKSFEFEEVPLHLARHNLFVPDYTLPTDQVQEPHLWHSISLSRPLSPLTPISKPPQNLLQKPTIIKMTTPTTMPPRGHSSAPQFNPDIPRELQRYFKELEMLFTTAQIVNNKEKKKHACRYVDIDTADPWESIPEFDITRTFDKFKTAIFKLYPGSESERKWTIADMDKLVGEQLWMGILNVTDLGNYYQMFYSITKFLLTKNRILEAEQSRAFVREFQPDLWC
jgi:hypothetical protein